MKTNEELMLKLEKKTIKKFSKEYINLTSKIFNKIKKYPNKDKFVFKYHDKSKVFDSGVFQRALERYFSEKNMTLSSKYGKCKTIYISVAKQTI